MMEDLETDTLHLALTRPPMVMGLPHTVFAVLFIITGLIIPITGNPFYAFISAPLWVIAKALVARDYNAFNVYLKYLSTSFRSLDSSVWGGASITPFPIQLKKRGRGIIDNAR